MIGKTILHYKILSKLGEGGMGVVYKAEDSKLMREVAIKFLPRQIATSEEERARFKIEAQAAAALNHANIATIHYIEDAEDETFIVMEYVDGQELTENIESGPLPIDETLAHAIQIASGLQAAHEKGVVHRDIKSANIMLTRKGEVKIMDFGLAKRGGQTKLTKEGTTLGTAAYMSPEQTRGEDVDHRSDIFSFGVLLYEMLTGQLPFKGDYDQAVTYSILNEDPEPVTGLRTGIPLELERIVNKCLKKDSAARYQHADELIADLRELAETGRQGARSSGSETAEPPPRNKAKWLWPTAVIALLVVVGYIYMTQRRERAIVIPQRIMLAVLPFENLGQAEDEYFADGMTEELTSRLAEISQLGIIARNSAMQYKSTDKSIQDIGDELGVGFLLDGTVRWEKQAGSESRVRVTPQLIRVSDATHLWTKRYDAVLASVFQIQSDISEQVAQALQIKLLDQEREELRAKPTDNIEAYDYYLRGKVHYNLSVDEENLRLAVSMYENAIRLDPDFAMAYAELGKTHASFYWHFYDRSQERLAKAKEAIDRAFMLEPELQEAFTSLGHYYYWGYLDYEAALKQFDIARKHGSENADILSGIAWVKRRQGKLEETIDYLEKAAILDPKSALIVTNIGETYALLRNYPKAEQYFDKTTKLDPEPLATFASKIALFLKLGDTASAQSFVNESMQFPGASDNIYFQREKVQTHILSGDYAAALQQMLESEIQSFDSQFFVTPRMLYLAQIYGLTNQNELERTYYDSARIELQGRLAEGPDDERLHSALGIAYAGLGLKDEATESGGRGMALLPISKEAYRGAYRVGDMARINVMLGEYEAALHLIEQLLSMPSYLSVGLLRLDPIWKPLVDQPRFQEILQKYGD